MRAASLCREGFGCRVLSVCARENVPVEELADWSLNIPWAFDEAVCQTRTVSNLYAAALGLACIAGGDEAGLEALSRLPALARGWPRRARWPSRRSAAATRTTITCSTAVMGRWYR